MDTHVEALARPDPCGNVRTGVGPTETSALGQGQYVATTYSCRVILLVGLEPTTYGS